ncbi:MAG: bifunctional diguanylate cyclase/phosphodiesterase, partial [Pseudonocardia sp.]|nr:bifunctional diguanylate cyclase/phosphodiesterase [Pseudonocardia sp.]
MDPGFGVGALEDDLAGALYQELRDGQRAGEHYAELHLPGDHVLSCRAEAEYTPDGAPVRLVGVVRDVTDHRRSDTRVQQAARRFADLMALVPGGVAVVDSGGVVVDASTELGALLGRPLEKLRGSPAAQLAAEPHSLDEPLAGSLPGWLRPVPPGARYGYRLESVPLCRGDGTTVWCELSASTTAADDGSWFWLVVCTDTSERRQVAHAAEKLRGAGTVDELTRLPNRAAIISLLDRHLAAPGRDRVAVVCGDLDDFQRVNSSLGHDAGDELLVNLAVRLQRELPIGCTAARLGGDEFVVICADHLAVGGADQFARVVADLLRTTITVHGRPVVVTASVGIATPVPAGDVRAADLLRFAEAAMHDAKRRQERCAIGTATDGVVYSATKALELEAELRAAIADDGLTLEFQPVVAPNGVVGSAEALVRWPHPEWGMVSPADFLPVAQRGGLLRELDMWVLRTAAHEAASWPAAADGRPASVAVNLAGLLPGDPDFRAIVSDIVDEAGLAWDRLVLELVETSMVALAPHALAAMAELAARGVRFAVDDFGTGYSSLARLKTLPAQLVKVDRAFVTGIADDPADFAVARAVVDMAKAMNRTTVAEGVETAEQFHVLRGIGVDAYQGWLFSPALNPADVRDVLARGR